MSLRAFLVDDEPLARARLARLLAATGRVEVVGQAGDAAEALAALDRVAADVAFLDIHMPGMSGLELVERLPRGLPVVFVTAYDQHDPATFVRIHRTTLLNLDHLQEIQPWPGGRLLVRLKDAKRTELQVARDRVHALRERLGI